MDPFLFGLFLITYLLVGLLIFSLHEDAHFYVDDVAVNFPKSALLLFLFFIVIWPLDLTYKFIRTFIFNK